MTILPTSNGIKVTGSSIELDSLSLALEREGIMFTAYSYHIDIPGSQSGFKGIEEIVQKVYQSIMG